MQSSLFELLSTDETDRENYEMQSLIQRGHKNDRTMKRERPDAVVRLGSSVPGCTNCQRQTFRGGVTFHVSDQLVCQHTCQKTLLYTPNPQNRLVSITAPHTVIIIQQTPTKYINHKILIVPFITAKR